MNKHNEYENRRIISSSFCALVGVVTNKQYDLNACESSLFEQTVMRMKTDELYHPQFFTATIVKWKHLLANDEFKNIIIGSLGFLKNEGSILIYAFVIMPNHIHLIWQIQEGFRRDRVQMRFLKFTAQQIKFKLRDTANAFLEEFKVELGDREYQFWQRNSLSIDLWSDYVFIQKLEYIHNNPIQEKWSLAEYPENYKYSSANFYLNDVDEFGLLSHYNGD